MKILFQTFECKLNKTEYVNGRTALVLEDINDGQNVAVATINVPKQKLEHDEVIIKNYGENEGILDLLVSHKIISQPLKHVVTGLTSSPICKILI